MKPHLAFGLFFILFLMGCSWIERFTITNESNEEVVVLYKLTDNQTGFPLFTNNPQFYSLHAKSKKIDWENEIQIIDKDTSLTAVLITLPPKSIMIFGNLHNDTYKQYDQQFINDRHFNLQQIRITTNQKEEIISAQTFDSFFIKKDGFINYRIN